MSNPNAPRPTRRALVAGGVSLLASGAASADLPPLRGDRKQFVQFEPQPFMLPLHLQDVRGRPATLALPRGDALLLYVWATWCPSCVVEIPRLVRDESGIVGLGARLATVSIDTGPVAAVATFLQRYGATSLRVFHDPGGTALSAERPDGTSSPFQRWSMPLTFAIDQLGYVRGYLAGSIDWLKPESTAFLQALGR